MQQRSGGAAITSIVIALCAVAGAVGAGSAASASSASTMAVRVPHATQCPASKVRVRATTSQHSYAPQTVVAMTVTARNVSSATCDIATGAISPSFDVVNAKGVSVWNNCDIDDRPGACPMYVVLKVALKPGQRFVRTVRWDQRSGEVPVQVPDGRYAVTAQFSGASAARAHFTIAR
jgi:anti-sigma factor RsiW